MPVIQRYSAHIYIISYLVIFTFIMKLRKIKNKKKTPFIVLFHLHLAIVILTKHYNIFTVWIFHYLLMLLQVTTHFLSPLLQKLD